MRFKTYSGTEYHIKNIEQVIQQTGEALPNVGPSGIPVVIYYRGELARLADYAILSRYEPYENTDEYHHVEFLHMPFEGECFYYDHPVWGNGCRSSIVVEIEEDDPDMPLKTTLGDENEEEHVKVNV